LRLVCEAGAEQKLETGFGFGEELETETDDHLASPWLRLVSRSQAETMLTDAVIGGVCTTDRLWLAADLHACAVGRASWTACFWCDPAMMG
jgi:hypothetical protein